MIDSHCHIADAKFVADRDDVLARAHAAGVHRIIAIADSLPEAKDCLQLAEKYEQIYCTVGVHPHCSKQWNSASAQQLRDCITASKKVVAVGEIGLDYHYMNAPKDVQQAVFTEQLHIAKECQLPCVIHNRESIADLTRIVATVHPPRFVVHCCTEKWADVAELVEAGHFLSFTGIATYPKSDDIRNTIQNCPLEQMMIETDAPYLAPVPYRGKRNEPAYVVEIAKCIAEVKGVPLAEVDAVTTRNAEAFFRLT